MESLVARARTGDRESFGEIVDRYTRAIEAYIRLRLGDQLRHKFELEDLVQETFPEAWRSIHARWS